MLDFVVVVDGGFGLNGEGEVLEDACSSGVLWVDSVVVVGWYRSLRLWLGVLIVEYTVVVIMKDNGWR